MGEHRTWVSRANREPSITTEQVAARRLTELLAQIEDARTKLARVQGSAIGEHDRVRLANVQAHLQSASVWVSSVIESGR